MKEISEVEEKLFTSSLIINIFPGAYCRKGLERAHSRSVDISFKDDVTVILLIVSFML
jgi:hypothetical protein